jgi:hypothetical protein
MQRFGISIGEDAMQQPRASTQNDSGSTAAQAQEKVQEQALRARDQARERMRDQVDQRSTQAGERVTSTAGDVRSVAQGLRDQGKEQPAKLAEQAADRVERLGGYLQESDGDRILHDLEDMARRQPWAVALGGVALGFLAARFLKASSTQRYQQLQSGGDYRTQPPRYTPRPPVAGSDYTARTPVAGNA